MTLECAGILLGYDSLALAPSPFGRGDLFVQKKGGIQGTNVKPLKPWKQRLSVARKKKVTFARSRVQHIHKG